MKKVTDPQSIRVTEIPKSNDANPAGVIWPAADKRLDGDSDGGTGTIGARSEKDNGVGEGCRRLKTRVDNSQKILDC